jgi:hypothetical protein
MIIVVHEKDKQVTIDNGNSIQRFAYSHFKVWNDKSVTFYHSGVVFLDIQYGCAVILYADAIAEADNVIRE